MKGHPVLETYQPKPPVVNDSVISHGVKGVKGGLVTVVQKIEFVASATDIYNTLLDKNRVQIWTRSGNVEITKAPGSSFSLFDGNVTGSIVELVNQLSDESCLILVIG